MPGVLYEALTGLIFAVTYGAIVLRNVGRFSLPIWLILVGGAAAMVATGAIGVGQAYSAINMQVLTFLFSMFVLVTALDISGALDGFAAALLRMARRPTDVILLVFVGFAAASALLMNDTLALMGTPVVISLARRMRVSAKPLLLTLAFAVTLGSLSTPMGNPQNLLVALVSGMAVPLFTFARFLLLPSLVGLLAAYLILRHLFSGSFSSGALNEAKSQTIDQHPKDAGLARAAVATSALCLGLILLVNLLQAAGVSQPFGISEVSLFCAALLLLVSGRSREIVASLDWGILLMFAGLFVLMEAMSENGVIQLMAGYLPALTAGAPASSLASIVIAGVLLSQVVSNVPMVALYLPLMVSRGFTGGDAYAWAALAGSSTLAGNLTILGAASNLIIIERAEKLGERLSFSEFLRVGVPVTVATVSALYLLLLAGL